MATTRLDTLTLATILVPDAGRYGLEALAYHLDFPPPPGTSHRAGTDANTTIELFLALLGARSLLSLAQLEEIVQAGKTIGWPETLFFEDVLAERARHCVRPAASYARPANCRACTTPRWSRVSPWCRSRPPTPLDIEWLTDLIMPGGHFERDVSRDLSIGRSRWR